MNQSKGFVMKTLSLLLLAVLIGSLLLGIQAAQDDKPRTGIRLVTSHGSDISQPTFIRNTNDQYPPRFFNGSPLTWSYRITQEEPLSIVIRGNTELSVSGESHVHLMSLYPFTLNGHISDGNFGIYSLDYQVLEEDVTVILDGMTILVTVIAEDARVSIR